MRSLQPRHDHGMGGGDMGSMGSMGDDDDMSLGTISVYRLPEVYWTFVGAVIAAFSFVHLIHYFLYRQRIYAASRKQRLPAKPHNLLTATWATISAVARECTNASLPPLRLRTLTLHWPTVGPIAMILAYATLIIVLCFYRLDLTDRWEYESIGYRTGFVSLAQLPLIFLLAGKNNIIGVLTGMSYERLNWVHRWVARCLLLSTTIHMGYWFSDWAPYHYIGRKIASDPITQKGLAAWSILVWIVFSSFAPIRNISYEFFVLQHLVSFVGFIAAVWIHTPASDHVWVYIPVALFAFDRIARALRMLYVNMAIFHKQSRGNSSSKLWAHEAKLNTLPHNVTRVTIKNPPMNWSPGQHAFLSCHSIVPLQSHPFTISSLPQDGKLEFLVRARQGASRKLFHHASKTLNVPTLPTETSLELSSVVSVALEGPYGQMRPLRQFDSVVFFAGSIGATFTVPLLRDLVRQWHESTISRSRPTKSLLAEPLGVVTRHIRFIWAIKSREQLCWFSDHLSKVVEDVDALRKENVDLTVEISVYVTCDSDMAGSSPVSTPASAPETNFLSYVNSNPSIDDEKEMKKASETIDVREIDPRSESLPQATAISARNQNTTKACGPDGTCCCQTTIINEDSNIINSDAICSCNHSHSIPTSSSSSSAISCTSLEKKNVALTTSSNPQKQTPHQLHSSIVLLSGRPHPRTIIRTSLEQARGETAVVVCGPKGFNNSVRSTVVSLSDERAVHKGTGALGIWFWSEGFAW